MATNPYYNKVVNGETGAVLIDLTADTITASSLSQGYTAHDATGKPIDGLLSFVTYYTSSSTPNSSQGSDGDVWLVV